MNWILGSAALDLSFILFPGLLFAAVSTRAPEASALFTALAFIALVLVDTGHVYSTLWRTYFRREELSSSPVYWLTPPAVVLVMTVWFALGLPHAWAFVVYATMFHHFRQYYGMLRWYERLNGRTCRASGLFLYVLTILPFILLHLRPEPRLKSLTLYADHDLFFAHHAGLYGAGLCLLAAAWAAWLGFETSLWRRGLREWNRLLAVLAPSSLSGACFLLGASPASMVLPLLIAHGVPYFAVMTLSLRRLAPRRFPAWTWAAGALLATALVCGIGETALERTVLRIDNDYVGAGTGTLQALLLGAYLVPLFCHYVFDAYIWTGRHREAKIVYALPGSRDPGRV